MTGPKIPRKASLTQARLKEVLHYDPATGLFRWLVSPNNFVKAGDIAGSCSDAYVKICVDGIVYKAQRLACLFMEGAWPQHQVDHKNRRRQDNRWKNLRPATEVENGQNLSKYKNNTSGHTGVSWHKGKKKWGASVCFRRKHHQAGYFVSLDSAIAARAALKAKLHKFHPIDNLLAKE